MLKEAAQQAALADSLQLCRQLAVSYAGLVLTLDMFPQPAEASKRGALQLLDALDAASAASAASGSLSGPGSSGGGGSLPGEGQGMGRRGAGGARDGSTLAAWMSACVHSCRNRCVTESLPA